MKPKIVSWNVRGLNEYNKRSRIKNLLREWRADIVCLQETKLKLVTQKIVRSVWHCPYVDWVYLASNGASGGILVMWDKRVMMKREEFIGEYTVAVSLKMVEDNFLWAFAGIYGPNVDNIRHQLWEEIARVHSWWDLPWCIGGDFNITRFPSERSGDSRTRPAMTEFSDCIFELNLVDLPLIGGPFTWSNNQTWSRLDRFLISPEWECQYPDVCQRRLPRLCSDHFPILLDGGGIQSGRRYFKFENMWLKSEGFVDKVRSWWSSYQFNGTPSHILAGKLKALNEDLKLWNSQSFGDLGEQKKDMMGELQFLESINEGRSLSVEERTRKAKLT
ncbi:hypothetical protein CIPAW_01G225900 [Carya illinoinensis]|uniref:Endonuclease/exonuclease/phosphatase domain-containing protein n=1 Tax=Carya illinoinensis TaxID=32201 RepID=A0A8T1RR21_CARIL|nr:hypothetical protein CIPAW_01G225900 [Carya illinoinensis]